MRNEFDDNDLGAQELMPQLINYCDYTYNLIFDQINNKDILDFGSGFGDFCTFLNSKGLSATAYEPNNIGYKQCISKKLNTYLDIKEIQTKYSVVTSICVLEHIEDDINALHQIKNLLIEDGKLILFLPASMIVWSQMDEDVNHFRRYSNLEITKKLEQAGFRVESINYVDFIGWLVLLIFKIFRIKPKFNRNLTIFYDKFIFKFFKYLDIFFRKIIGKNILITASTIK